MKTPLRTLLLALPLVVAACQSTSPSTRLARMFTELHEDVGERKLGQDEGDAWWRRQVERLETVRTMVEKKQVSTALDHLYASVVLVETDSESDLALAHQLALASAEKGEARGFRVAAEALDKLCIKRGLAQKYGTQYVYEPVIKAWRLYPIDPNTTDAERAAMGVESMEKLQAREAKLNEMTGGKPN
ncbi:MAG: hypothetical protein IPJ77_14440 [Planctomycetes bacterium]|nr:hypothetical protein [Planctomycetota bacterium]